MDSRVEPAWAEQVVEALDRQRRELLEVEPRSQVEEALLGDAALDVALLALLLDRPLPEVTATLDEARLALLRVAGLSGTAQALPVVVIDEEGLDVSVPAIDDSLNTTERARLARHLGALLGIEEPPVRGTKAEAAVAVALDRGDRRAFVSALEQVLAAHDHPGRDPRALVSVPALGLAATAMRRGLVDAVDLPAHPALPLRLLHHVVPR